MQGIRCFKSLNRKDVSSASIPWLPPSIEGSAVDTSSHDSRANADHFDCELFSQNAESVNGLSSIITDNVNHQLVGNGNLLRQPRSSISSTLSPDLNRHPTPTTPPRRGS